MYVCEVIFQERWEHYVSEAVPQWTGGPMGEPVRDGTTWFYEPGEDKAFRFDPTSTQWTVYAGLPLGVGSYFASDALFL